MKKIRIGIVGFGNLGKACKELIEQSEEFELVAVFSRRAVQGTVAFDKIETFKDKIDVMLVCVASKEDAPKIVPEVAKTFNTVDSFDTHTKITEYIVDIKKAWIAASQELRSTVVDGRSTPRNDKVAIVAAGWDPGLMSVIRMYFSAFIPQGPTQSFWGPGVSLGHSNALRQIDGVRDAVQFTVPAKNVMKKAARGVKIESNKRHVRVCLIVATRADRARIRQEILGMLDYFAGQVVKVKFVSQAAFNKKFRDRTEHAGAVISADDRSTAAFSLRLKSNAHFCASVMLAYAIANFNMQAAGQKGVFTATDIAPKYLFRRDILDLI